VRMVVAGRMSAGPLPEGLRVWSEKRPLPVPQVVSMESNADYGIPVARTEWTTYFPKDAEVYFVDDPKLTNVNPSGEGEALLFERAATIDEMKQLLSVLDSSGSMRTNYQVRQNLKNLDAALRSSRSASVGSRELASREAELNRINGELEKKIQDQESKAASEQAEETARVGATGGEGERFTPAAQARQAKTLLQGNVQIRQPSDDAFSDADSDSRLGTVERGEKNRFGFQLGAPVDGKEVPFPLNVPNAPSAGESAKKSSMRRQAAPAQSLAKQLESEEVGNTARDEQKTDQDKITAQPAPPPAATVAEPTQGRSPGSLSLDFDIPIDGSKRVFTKVGGDPKLTVALLPHRSFDVLLSAGWTIVWGLLAVLIVVAVGHSRSAVAAGRSLPLVALALGALLFLVFPAPVSWIGLAILVVATGVETLRRTRLPRTGS
jgi:hypothetical protein